LLELDLGQAIVLEDDDLDREIVLHGGRHLRHQHGEPAELGNPSFGCDLSPIDFVALARATRAEG
jgi:hypothetical protein